MFRLRREDVSQGECFVNVISFASVVALCLYVFLGVFTVRNIGSRTAEKWIFAAFCLLYAAWSFMYSFMSTAATKEAAWAWVHVFSFSWTISASIFLHFALVFSGVVKPKNIVVPVAVYLPGVVFAVKGAIGPLFFDELMLVNGLWSEIVSRPSIWALAYMIYYYAFIVAGLAAIGVWGFRSANLKHRRQAQTIITGYAVTFVFITFQNHVQPLLGITFPHIPHLWTLFWMASIWYAMHKYEFLNSVLVRTAKNPMWKLFTKREHEIIGLLMRGYSYRQIGEMLFISYYTVKSHVENIYSKAGVGNRTELLFNLGATDQGTLVGLN